MWKPYPFEPPLIPTVSNPTILAFSCYFHDSSACIIKEGKIQAAVDEERFTRRKHDAAFPIHAINYCLKEANVKEVDFVVFYENPDIKWERIRETLLKNPPSKEVYNKIITSWNEIKSKEKIQTDL
jgi:carbamoyltransferase